jgi:hypothetical protein
MFPDIKLDIPALVLLLVFALGAWVLWRTQTSENNFDFADMLRDTEGKASSSRLAMFVCLAVSSWGFMYLLITKKGEMDTWLFLGYVGIWSGTKVAEKGIDMYAASRGVNSSTISDALTTTRVVKRTSKTGDGDADTQNK